MYHCTVTYWAFHRHFKEKSTGRGSGGHVLSIFLAYGSFIINQLSRCFKYRTFNVLTSFDQVWTWVFEFQPSKLTKLTQGNALFNASQVSRESWSVFTNGYRLTNLRYQVKRKKEKTLYDFWLYNYLSIIGNYIIKILLILVDTRWYGKRFVRIQLAINVWITPGWKSEHRWNQRPDKIIVDMTIPR